MLIKKKNNVTKFESYSNKNIDGDIPDGMDMNDLGLENNSDSNTNLDFDSDFSDSSDNGLMNDSSILGINDGVQPMEKHNDLLRELTNFDPYIKDKFKAWLGLKWDDSAERYVQNTYILWDETNQKYREEKVKPMMNLLCAEWCINLLRDYTRGNNIITVIDNEEYEIFIGDVVETVWKVLVSKSKEFNLRLDEDIYSIAVSLEHAVRLVLTGAGGGGYSRLLTGTMSRNETVTHNPNNQPNNSNNMSFFSAVKKSLFGGK